MLLQLLLLLLLSLNNPRAAGREQLPCLFLSGLHNFFPLFCRNVRRRHGSRRRCITQSRSAASAAAGTRRRDILLLVALSLAPTSTRAALFSCHLGVTTNASGWRRFGCHDFLLKHIKRAISDRGRKHGRRRIRKSASILSSSNRLDRCPGATR